MPLASKATKLGVCPDSKMLVAVMFVPVALVRMEEEAFKLVKLAVVALKVPFRVKRFKPLFQSRLLEPLKEPLLFQ